jgi:hypothetical protein
MASVDDHASLYEDAAGAVGALLDALGPDDPFSRACRTLQEALSLRLVSSGARIWPSTVADAEWTAITTVVETMHRQAAALPPNSRVRAWLIRIQTPLAA